MVHKITSSQPEVSKTRIYGSTPVTPLEEASNQPEVISTKIYGSKQTPTIRVRMKGDRTKQVSTIDVTDFDAAKHIVVE